MMFTDIPKATDFYAIQDAVASNIPVDETHPFYMNFSEYRSSFKEEKIYRNLSIVSRTNECKGLVQPKKIFLSGYRGTGKTTELLKLKNTIHDTKCYFTIFVDISDEELDTNNIQTVDILILMLEKLLDNLKQEGANIDEDVLKSFYEWYNTRIEEVNKTEGASVDIEAEASASAGFLGFFKLTARTKAQLKGTSETKEVIRRVFNKHFSDFTDKFNEFILSTKEKLKETSTSYQDILFIIDGFEKIGTLADRRKILLDDANKFTLIRTHMLITLPIELFNERHRIVSSGGISTLHLPLIDLDIAGAKDSMKTFILKRVDEALFADEQTIDKIIEFGAGHPRQTLQIVSRAYLVADNEKIDVKSVEEAIKEMGRELVDLDEEEMDILKAIHNDNTPVANDAYIGLKGKNILFEYNDEKSNIINPILEAHPLYKKRLESLDA